MIKKFIISPRKFSYFVNLKCVSQGTEEVYPDMVSWENLSTDINFNYIKYLGCNEDILSLDDALPDGLLYGVSQWLFGVVDCGCIKMPVAQF